MKYFLSVALVIQSLAIPALAHHAPDAEPLHAAEHTAIWVAIVAALVVTYAICRHYKARSSQT